jgi:hypothetical protein
MSLSIVGGRHHLQRQVMLGRPLLPREVVYHANSNTRDKHSEKEHLGVLQSARAHMIYHNYLWQEQRGIVPLFPVEDVLGL